VGDGERECEMGRWGGGEGERDVTNQDNNF